MRDNGDKHLTLDIYLDLFSFHNLCTCGCKQIYFLGGYRQGQSVLSSRCQMDQIHPCIWGILTINNTFIIYNLAVLESDFIIWFHAFQQPDTWIFFNLHKFYVAKIEFHQKITQTTKNEVWLVWYCRFGCWVIVYDKEGNLGCIFEVYLKKKTCQRCTISQNAHLSLQKKSSNDLPTNKP